MSAPKPDRSPGGVVPGLLLVALVGVAAHLLHGLLPKWIATALGEVIFAVILGLAAGNALRLPAATAPGIRFAFQTLLRLAIVLLGAGFSFLSALAIGGKALGMVAALMVLALVVAHSLGRAAGVHDKLATLIGVGTAVCGNSAISATAPVIGATDEDMAFAIATNTLFGTLAVFAYPLLGHALGLSDAAFGTWAGTAVNDTSQVVATGFAYSEAAGRVATVVKLTRNALMGVVIVALGLIYGRRQDGSRKGAGIGARLRQSVPAFVLGFLAMAVLNTLGLFGRLSEWTGSDVGAILQSAARWLILFALAGVGLGTRLAAMRRTGLRPFYVGLATAACTSLASYLLILLLGPAGK
jgi:uncharacterized integral membrane protein (TIGR00698 family)